MLSWSREITIPGASTLRVHFGRDTLLAGPDRHSGGSYLVITSAKDWAKHYLDAETLHEWDRISAIMNGETVFVELYTVPGAGENRVTIENVTAAMEGGADTICGTTDNRVPYNEPRTGRLSTGCTGWLISRNGAANEFLTAGHCLSTGQTGALMLFNVPPSTSTGGLVAPPPEFQFPVQSASIQRFDGASIGDDWARFNTNNNSNTRMAARIAQGRGSYLLASAAPASGTAATTVRGHGVVNDQAGIPLVPEQWNQINKTHTAAYAGKVGTRIDYLTDTDGGNSGSPVTQFIGSPFAIEQAIGIHTDGLCPAPGENHGTAIEHAGLQAALNAPAGVARPYDSAVSKGLSTTFVSDNGGSKGGSIFFDVTTGVHSITVTNLLLNINRLGTSSNATTTEDDDFFNFNVYVTPDTAQGKQTNSALWTLVAQGAGMPKPEDEGTLGALKDTFVLNGSQSYGIAVVFDSAAAHAYTDANGTNETYSNADLSITGISASNSSFGTVISSRVFNGGIGYQLNQASGQCLETIYAQNNNGSNGGMVYFNVQVGSQPVTLSGLSTNVEGAGGLDCDIRLYRRVGTAVGFETSPGAWTQVATASGLSSPVDTPSQFGLSNFVTLNANTLYGFAIQLDTTGGAGTEGHAYTNSTTLNTTYADSRLAINLGSASNTPFGANIDSRVWNGSLCYGVSLATCSGNLFGHQPPNPTLSGLNSTPGAQEEADNFANLQNWSLTGGTFWGAYSTPATPPPSQDMVIRVFSDSGGLPGALVATRNVANVPVVDTGLFMTPLSRPIYQYNMTWTPIALPPGQYWVSALGNQAGYTWAWARANNTASAHAFRNGAGAWGPSAGDFAFVLCGTATPVACYANCDLSTIAPVLNVNDFTCFLNRYAAGQSYANCDASTIAPVLNVNDFTCFLNRYAAGCP